MQTGAIVLCGGQSTRMGASKAMLPFGDELMLQRVVRILGDVVEPRHTVVVAAPGQQVPRLHEDVEVARDQREQRGPLEGIAAGLRSLAGRVDAAYVSSCDVPLLQPAFVRAMFTALGDAQIAVPKDGKYHHPLAAVYRLDVLRAVDALLAADRMRPFFLFEACETAEIDVATLRQADPELQSLVNLNRREDYLHALRAAGIEQIDS